MAALYIGTVLFFVVMMTLAFSIPFCYYLEQDRRRTTH